MEHMKTEETALLKQAFASFDEAAGTLERAYQMLSGRVQELNVELEVSNQALRESLASNEEIKSHLHAILESLTSGVLVTDLNAQITTVNRAAELMLEMDRQELTGQSLSELLRDWGYGEPLAGEVVRKSRRLSVVLTDLRGDDGQPGTDIDERVRAAGQRHLPARDDQPEHGDPDSQRQHPLLELAYGRLAGQVGRRYLHPPGGGLGHHPGDP